MCSVETLFNWFENEDPKNEQTHVRVYGLFHAGRVVCYAASQSPPLQGEVHDASSVKSGSLSGCQNNV